MQKRISSKIVIAAVAVVAAAAVGIGFAVKHASKDAAAFRSILVYDLEGSADIDRAQTGTIPAAENLYLESKDRVSVAEESFMRLKLDSDKYAMAEENSVFSLEAEGSGENSKTRIYLEQGAITNEIENKLKGDSIYEVTTPNSVMAVRGTVFRIEVYRDENGEIYTKTSVIRGEVSIKRLLPDGTYGEERVTESGKEVVVCGGDEQTEYLGDTREIAFEELPLQTLYVLQEYMDDGFTVHGMDREGLSELIDSREGADENGGPQNIRPQGQEDPAEDGAQAADGAGTADETSGPEGQPSAIGSGQTDSPPQNNDTGSHSGSGSTGVLAQNQDTGSTRVNAGSGSTGRPTGGSAVKQPTGSGKTDGKKPSPSGGNAAVKPTNSGKTDGKKPSPSGSTTGSSTGGSGTAAGGQSGSGTDNGSPSGGTTSGSGTDNGSPSGGTTDGGGTTSGSGTDNGSTPGGDTPDSGTTGGSGTDSSTTGGNGSSSTGSSGTSGSTGGSTGSSGTGSSGGSGTSGGTGTEEKKCTVTFLYNGNIFGTQTVQQGGHASKPRLEPSSAGSWDFDFTAAIEEDTQIVWKEQ